MTTGQRIKEARKKAGLTQAALAEKLGISYVGVSQWENDLRNPKYETLQRIATALGVSVADLLGQDKQEESSKFWGAFLHEKLWSVGCSLHADQDGNAYIWINYPDGTLEVTEDELKELDQSTSSFIRFKLQELRDQHPEDFRPKQKRRENRPQPTQDGGESTSPAREGKDTTRASDAPETPPEGK